MRILGKERLSPSFFNDSHAVNPQRLQHAVDNRIRVESGLLVLNFGLVMFLKKIG